MDKILLSQYIDYIDRCFRDTADKDYITARILYKYELGPQFLWASQQAIEKYLKSILLYNHKSTKDLKHYIYKSFGRLKQINYIKFDFPENVIKFIEYLDDQGPNRYLEKFAYTDGKELLLLDRSVWYIRKYCFFLHGKTSPDAKGNRVDLFPIHIKQIRSLDEKLSNKYHLFNGFLEKVLKDKRSKVRKYLVWKNFYYGSYKKKIIQNFAMSSWSFVPTYYNHPKLFELLDKRIIFSERFRKEFLSQINKMRK